MLKSIAFALVLLAALFHGSDAQEFSLGGCPKVDVKQDFDLNSYLGTWYQYGTWCTRGIEGRGKCVKSVYKYKDNTGLVELTKTQVPLGTPAKASLVGNVAYEDPASGKGALTMTMPMPVFGKTTFTYKILGTDYASWSVSYACANFYLFSFSSAWIHTREPNPGSYLEEEINQVLKKIHLTTANFRRTDQINCQ